jgi:hypothetical protein
MNLESSCNCRIWWSYICIILSTKCINVVLMNLKLLLLGHNWIQFLTCYTTEKRMINYYHVEVQVDFKKTRETQIRLQWLQRQDGVFFSAKFFNLLRGLAIYVTTHGESKYTFNILSKIFWSPPEHASNVPERASGPGLSIIEENSEFSTSYVCLESNNKL